MDSAQHRNMAFRWLKAPQSIESDTSEGLYTVDLRGGGLQDFEIDGGPNRGYVSGALWVPQDGTSETTPILLFGHGASGDRFQQPGRWLAASRPHG